MAPSHGDFLFLFLMLSWPYVLRWIWGGGTTSVVSYWTAATSNLASGRNVLKAWALLQEEDTCPATHHGPSVNFNELAFRLLDRKQASRSASHTASGVSRWNSFYCPILDNWAQRGICLNMQITSVNSNTSDSKSSHSQGWLYLPFLSRSLLRVKFTAVGFASTRSLSPIVTDIELLGF